MVDGDGVRGGDWHSDGGGQWGDRDGGGKWRWKWEVEMEVVDGDGSGRW